MAEENKKLHIRLHVYDTDIPVNINREDEYYYREAAKLITSTVNKYSDAYKGRKSDKEIMYMAMVEIALKFQMELGHNDTSEYDNILKKLIGEIEEAIS